MTREELGEEKEKHTVKVVVDIAVDTDSLYFPTDKNGVLIWNPFACIEDFISHRLFKEHDASYMGTLGEGLEFAGWRVKFPKELIKKLAEIMVKNFWDHPDEKRGREPHNKYSTLEDAIKQVTKDAMQAFG